MYKILMVDDDAKNLDATKSFLKACGYEVDTTTSPSEALELAKEDEYALALFDFQMPEMNGDSLATLVRQVSPHQQIAMYSCDLSRDAIKSSMRAGAVDFIDKSMPPQEFKVLIESYCNRYETLYRTIRPSKHKSENRKIVESLGMVGESKQAVAVSMIVHKVALASDTSVLIRGESGTGKELVAQAIHKLSPRSGSQFVAINCAAIPANLLESELFGHMKGSFTGASHDHIGKFEFANKGTIFLDEIGDMPLELQAKLLRVIQERKIVPVGGKIPKNINVRIITATHRNLDEMVAKGLFREDLMYRIRVVEIEVPALRKRIEDIEPLIAHFADVYNKKNGTQKYVQRRTLEILKRYSWPGNVRELETTVEKLMILSNDIRIRPEDLVDLKFFESTPTTSQSLTLDQYRIRAENEELSFLENAIEDSGGNKAEAARRLQIKPSHLNHLMSGFKSEDNAEI